MMRVSGFESRDHAERRASYYRSMGYIVQIVAASGLICGPFFLHCTYGDR